MSGYSAEHGAYLRRLRRQRQGVALLEGRVRGK